METQIELFQEFTLKEIKKFYSYHIKNPSVYETFKKLTFEAKKLGHTHFSARGLFQVMRFKMGGEMKSDGFKYNNNYTPFYVRLIEKEYPEFVGFFEKRKSKADKILKL